MIGKNSLIVLILVALACIGFAILWHRCRLEPINPERDEIEAIRYEAEQKRIEAESVRIQTEAIRNQIEAHRAELKRLDSIYSALVGSDAGRDSADRVRDSIRAEYLRRVGQQIGVYAVP